MTGLDFRVQNGTPQEVYPVFAGLPGKEALTV